MTTRCRRCWRRSDWCRRFITPKVGPKPIDETGEEENVDLEGEEYSEETGDDEDIFNEEQEDTQDANFVF